MAIAQASVADPAGALTSFREALAKAIADADTKRKTKDLSQAFYDDYERRVQDAEAAISRRGLSETTEEARRTRQARKALGIFKAQLDAEIAASTAADAAIVSLQAKTESAQTLLQFAGVATSPVPPAPATTETRGAPTPPSTGVAVGTVTLSGVRAACSLERPFRPVAPDSTGYFDPQECLERPGATGRITIGERAVERQGLSAQLTSSGSATNATIRLADSYALRRETSDGGQQLNSWGWSMGLSTRAAEGADTAFLGRLPEKSRSRGLLEIDRLDERAKLIVGVNFNAVQTQSRETFQRAVRNAIDAATVACEADQAAKAARLCEPANLMVWIDRNATFKKQLNDAYWGAPKSEPTWGVGTQFEFALPRFEYYGFDPATITRVEDIPADYSAKDPSVDRKLQLTAQLYYYRKLTQNTTLIPSVTYKRAWEVPADGKDVTLCARDTGSSILVRSDCRKVNLSPPELVNSYYVGLEWRGLMEGKGFLPAIGLAPRYTYELDRGRSGLDVPIFLALDKLTGDGAVLNAGIKISGQWDGESAAGEKLKNDWGISLFVGTNFSLTGLMN
jgi:hypothetical protein